MNPFTAFIESTWTETAGWALLHSVWQIALSAAVYALVALRLRRGSANARYIAGCVTLLAMLALPVGTYAILARNASSQRVETGPATASAVPQADVEPSNASRTPERPDRLQTSGPASRIGAQMAAAPSSAFHSGAEATARSAVVRGLLPWVTAVWLAGVAIFSLRLACGWMHLRRLQHRGLTSLSDAVMAAGRRVASRLGVTRAIRFVQSSRIDSPSAVGLLRPMVLLPASAVTGLSIAEIEFILAHELAHVRRHDWTLNLVQTVIETLLFYHPAMWWVSRRVRQERENCCDDMAVALVGDRVAYARTLARLEEHRAVAGVNVVAAAGGSILLRVRRLLGEPNQSDDRRCPAVQLAGPITLILAMLVVGLGVTTGQPGPDESSPDLPAFERFHASGNSIWTGPRSLTFRGDGTYEFTMRMFEPVPGVDGRVRPRKEPYVSKHRLAPEHLRRLNRLLQATKWLTLAAKTPSDPMATDTTDYAFTLVRDGESREQTFNELGKVQAYADLVHFLRQVERQEVLYLRVTQPKAIFNGGGEGLGQELDAMMRPASDPHHIRPHAPALDYRRLVAPCAEILRSPDKHDSRQVIDSIKLMRYLQRDSARPELERLARGRVSSAKWSAHAATEVRIEAIKALGVIAAEDNLETFGRIVDAESDWQLNETAAKAVAGVPGEKADATLIDILRRAPRPEIAWLLIRRGKSVEPAIVDILYEPGESYFARNGAAQALVRAYHDHWEELPRPPSETVLTALHDWTLRHSNGPRPEYALRVLEMAGRPFVPGNAWQQLDDTLSLMAADDDPPRKKLFLPMHLRGGRLSEAEKRFLEDAEAGRLVIREILVDAEDFSAWAFVSQRDPPGGYGLYLSQGGRAVWVIKGAVEVPSDQLASHRRRFLEAHPEAKEIEPPKHDQPAPPSEASAPDIEIQLRPGLFREGRQWLSVRVANKSANRVIHLEPGGIPPELVIDDVAYRWTGADPVAETKRRAVRPGNANSGDSFALDGRWVTLDGTSALRLSPRVHTVRAIVHATRDDVKNEESGVPVRSNPIRIGPDGQAVGACDVRVRVFGGEAKKPLEGVELAVTPALGPVPLGQKPRISAIADEAGGASFRLSPGGYRVYVRSPEELPYLCPNHYLPIMVAEEPSKQQLEFTLPDPCELVLRAVDAETGRGVAGVVFCTECPDGEIWARPIWNETVNAPDFGRVQLDHESLRTDESGYFRRKVGPREGWTYFIWETPPGYEPIKPGEEVEIDTSLGRKRAEHTFLLRRVAHAAESR